ncbi:MAG: hypothetical protein IT419_16990 [Planctomycetes bacterium]|nr:hypothetical protein [Planctomycetota bacterium]
MSRDASIRGSIFANRPALRQSSEGRKKTYVEWEQRRRKAADEYAADPAPLAELLAELRSCLHYFDRHIEVRIEEQERERATDGRDAENRIVRAFRIGLARQNLAEGPTRGALEENIAEWMCRRWPGIPREHVQYVINAAIEAGWVKERQSGSDRTFHLLRKPAGESAAPADSSGIETGDQSGSVRSGLAAREGPFTTEECANRFNCSENTWRNWAKGKGCPPGLFIDPFGRGKWYFRNDAQSSTTKHNQ